MSFVCCSPPGRISAGVGIRELRSDVFFRKSRQESSSSFGSPPGQISIGMWRFASCRAVHDKFLVQGFASCVLLTSFQKSRQESNSLADIITVLSRDLRNKLCAWCDGENITNSKVATEVRSTLGAWVFPREAGSGPA